MNRSSEFSPHSENEVENSIHVSIVSDVLRLESELDVKVGVPEEVRGEVQALSEMHDQASSSISPPPIDLDYVRGRFD